MTSKRIQLFIMDGFEPLDLAGPLSAFAAANSAEPGSYRIETIGFDSGPIKPEAGPAVIPDATVGASTPPDILIFVGGRGPRETILEPRMATVLTAHAQRSKQILTVCTGAFLAARLGLLDGCVATTHWRHETDFQSEFPNVSLKADELHTRDGRIWCSAGVTAGIDASLAIIRDDLGAAVAAAVARQLVMYVQRSGGQTQYADTLRIQHGAPGKFAALIDWMRANLDKDLSISVLADRVAMSPRHFQRRFTERMGVTASVFVERLRLEEARAILTSPDASISRTAALVGFKNSDSFRRAFERVVGVSPSFYKRRFRESKPED